MNKAPSIINKIIIPKTTFNELLINNHQFSYIMDILKTFMVSSLNSMVKAFLKIFLKNH